jgi:transposase
MRFIRDLSRETEKMLERIYRQSKHHQVRSRAQCLILSFRGVRIKQLMAIFGVSRKTIHNWLTSWEDEKLVGIYNRSGRGRKPIFKHSQQEQIKEWVKESPKNLKKVLIKVEKEWEINVSKPTIKRILKKFDYRWKRMKRGLAGKPVTWEYELKLERLNELKEQEKKGEIDLRYLDETGFTLTPYIPYAWQEKGEVISLKSSQSKRLNVVGIINKKNEFFYEAYTGNSNSDTLIKFLDKFSNNLKQRTTVVMDQAPIHTSDKFLAKLPEWKSKNLEIFWLPTYSPKLNLIEILWKFIKYEWIEIEAYENWNSLVKYVKNVLNNVGSQYVINFA